MVLAADPSVWNERARLTWEDVPCPLCAHPKYRPLLEAADVDPAAEGLRFAIVRCLRCGLHYTNPRPNAETMNHFYRPSYAAFNKPKLLRNLTRRWYPLARLFGRPCRERRVLPWHGQGRLLDFGCGGGKFLLRMQDQGWKVVGLDRSTEIVRQVRDHLGVHALSGTLPHAGIEAASFDIITMWSTLAHVHQPLDVLREAQRILAPGGRLYVEVPNIESWAFRWFGSRWSGLDLPRHLTHFSADTLRTMLEMAGFRVLAMKSATHPDWLRSSARRQRGSPLVLQLLRLKPFAHFVSWLGYIARRADSILTIAERQQ